jgi:DNA polymerase-3 subunit epsilon
MDFVAIDFETANEDHASACALGLADVRDGKIVETRSWFIRPPNEHFRFSRKNKEIHGLGRGDVKNKSNFDELWPAIAPYITDRVVVAHNAPSTDIDILAKLFAHFSIEPPRFNYLCTLAVARKSWAQEIKSFTLESIANHFDIEFVHHDPEEDARVCAMILLAACEHKKAVSVEELCAHLQIDPESFASKMDRESGNELGSQNELINMHSENDPIQRRCMDKGVWKRGKKVFAENKVTLTRKLPWKCFGEVKGSEKEPYAVKVDYFLMASCPCYAWTRSDTKFCKHCVALALAWEKEGGPQQWEDMSSELKSESLEGRIKHLDDDRCKSILETLATRDPDLVMSAMSDEEGH